MINELSEDDEYVNKIDSHLQFCGKLGIIVQRSEYGWLYVHISSGRFEFFTPRCLQLVRASGFCNITVHQGEFFDERKSILTWISQHPGLLEIMKAEGILVLNLADSRQDANFWCNFSA